ncbi:MAG TPA: hypothetical protein VFI27_03130 [candidate division Zixibacteria bacterium]|nr:hypothetical protein [candidate division Zixibacteria bacterium]
MKKEDYTTCRCAILVDSGRAGTRTQDLTDVNRTDEDRFLYAGLLEVESFNKERF